jgi:hypothetical protein
MSMGVHPSLQILQSLSSTTDSASDVTIFFPVSIFQLILQPLQLFTYSVHRHPSNIPIQNSIKAEIDRHQPKTQKMEMA